MACPTKGLPDFFETVDVPYCLEMQDPASTQILLTAKFGRECVSPLMGTIYALDTSLLPDGKTRVIDYTRRVGQGGVTYFTLGHNHSPTTNSQRTVDTSVVTDGQPPMTFRGYWETPYFKTLLRNAIRWGLGE